MKKDPPAQICAAAFTLIAEKGWQALTLESLAKKTKLSQSALQKIVPRKESLLPLLVESLSADVCDSPAELPPHDRLFDVLMNRFDALQKRRGAILDIMTNIQRSPALLPYLIPAQIAAMNTLLERAGITPQGAEKKLAPYGLFTLYGVVLNVWRRDDTPDLSKTMSALDRHLRHAEKILTFIRNMPLAANNAAVSSTKIKKSA